MEVLYQVQLFFRSFYYILIKDQILLTVPISSAITKVIMWLFVSTRSNYYFIFFYPIFAAIQNCCAASLRHELQDMVSKDRFSMGLYRHSVIPPNSLTLTTTFKEITVVLVRKYFQNSPYNHKLYVSTSLQINQIRNNMLIS